MSFFLDENSIFLKSVFEQFAQLFGYYNLLKLVCAGLDLFFGRNFRLIKKCPKNPFLG